jgi:hypothetical protein
MKIFASSATQIDNSQEPANVGNYRYSDDSTRYSYGFQYLVKLNSATLNGILHRITGNIAKKLYISANQIKNFTIEYQAKYCSDEDIADPEAKNDTDYVLIEQTDAFIEAHALKKKKETVKALLTNQALDDTSYYDISEASKARGVAFGIELTPYVFQDYLFYLEPPQPATPAINAIPSRVMLFPPLGTLAREATAYVKVQVVVDDGFHVYEIRNSFNKISNKTVKTYLQFTGDVTYHGKTIKASAVLICLGTGFIIIKGDNLYALSGFVIPTAGFEEKKSPLSVPKTFKKKKNGHKISS